MRLLVAALVAALATTSATGQAADDAHRPPHPSSSAVAALRCGSATYACRTSAASAVGTAAALTPASVCVNLCVKGADPPKSPVPEGACGPPCTWPAEACVLAARAGAARAESNGGGGARGESADDGGSVLPALPLTHADFETSFEGLRPAGQACPLVVE